MSVSFHLSVSAAKMAEEMRGRSQVANVLFYKIVFGASMHVDNLSTDRNYIFRLIIYVR